MLKTKIIVASAVLLFSRLASADPGVFVGVTYAFGAGGGPGVSLKVLSTNKEDHAIVGAGVSYYPLADANKFGVDAGVGYLTKDAAVTVGWDFLQGAIQIGAGYVNTKDDNNDAPPPPPPPPPPV